MTEPEKKRFFRYSLRHYESMGPTRLAENIESLKNDLIKTTVLNENSFWEIYEDLVENNGWDAAYILAYFATFNFEN